MIVLYLLYVVYPILTRADVLWDKFGSTDKVLEQSKECISRLKSVRTVGSRFSDEQLAGFCAKEKLWRDDVRRASLKLSDTPVDIYTSKQKEWIDGIQQCSDWPSCLCPGGPSTCKKKPTRGTLLQDPVSANRTKRQAASNIAVRKEIRRMSDTERKTFFEALDKIKFERIDNKSKYDMLTLYHRPESAPGAHWGPGFLGWHRELLRQFEVSLRQVNPNVAVPYWDSTLDEGLPEPKDSVLFTPDFIGGDEVEPFKHWKSYYPRAKGEQHKIKRALGQTPFGFLLKPADVNQVLGYAKFDQLTMCVEPFFELVHGGPHNWIGGHMADIPISPDDPSFFLHHAFVDYIWDRFRNEKQTASQRKSDYPTDANSCNSHHFSNAPMAPYPRKNRDGISNIYSDNFYRYEPSPTCRKEKPDCNSEYLFCDTKEERCRSKIIIGGNCTGFESSQICHQGTCRDGVCVTVAAGRSTDENSVTGKLKPAARSNATCPCCRCDDTDLTDIIALRGDDSPYFYFPITILSGKLKGTKTPVSSAEILTVGTAEVGVHRGRFYESSTNYPHFFGNSVAKVPNPRFHNDRVDVFLTVTTGGGVRCRPHCHTSSAGYISCGGQLNLGDRHPVPTELNVTEIEEAALFLGWRGNVHKPTHYMFLCDSDEIELLPDELPDTSNEVEIKCRFQRFPGFELDVTAAQTLTEVKNSTFCKDSCRQSGICKSVQYYALKEICMIHTVSRLTYPDKFKYNEDEDVSYLDYRCDVLEAFEY